MSIPLLGNFIFVECLFSFFFTIPFLISFFQIVLPISFPNKHASKPKRIKYKPPANSSNYCPCASGNAMIQTHMLPPAASTNHNCHSHKTAAPRNLLPPHHQTLSLLLLIFITSLQYLSSPESLLFFLSFFILI